MQGEDTDGTLTCRSCHLRFSELDQHRAHFRSDLHRYNLRRRVAGLVPLSADAFAHSQGAQQGSNAPDDTSGRYQAVCYACKGKKYNSEHAFTQHTQSKKHKAAVKAFKGKVPTRVYEMNAQSADAPEKTEDELVQAKLDNAVDLDLEQCIFCPHRADSVEENCVHMEKEHGLFIPDLDCLVDLPGMLQYLGKKVAVGNACLWCDKVFGTLEAVRQHMTSLNHCKIEYEDNEDEYMEFYDFTSSYAGTEYEGLAPEEVGERVQSKVDVEMGGLQLVFTDSGKRVGHRSMQRYYKQGLQAGESRQDVLINQMIQRYRSTGLATSVARRVEQKAQLELRQKQHHTAMRASLKQNILKGRYFRRRDLNF